MCSFLNHSGGTILLGVDDNGNIIGVNPIQAENMKKAIINTTNNPELFIPSPNLYPEIVTIGDKTLIMLNVPTGEAVYQYKRHFYDRNGDADVDVTKQGGLLQAIFERKSPHIFESRIVEGLTIRDLDHITFEKCRKSLAGIAPEHPWITQNDREILHFCQLIVKDGITGDEHLTYAALLLFGTEESIIHYCPRYRVEAIYRNSSYDDYNKGKEVSISYDDRLTLHCNLISAYTKLLEFVVRHLPDKYYIPEGSIQRQDLRILLFRELCANMLVHADYSLGFGSFFEIYTDRVVTRNRTRLVSSAREGVISIDELENYTKNPFIVKVFRNLGWVEDLGSGMLKIKTYAPLYYKNSECEIRDDENFVFSVTYAPASSLKEISSEPIFKTPLHGLVYALLRQVPQTKTTEIRRYVNASQRTIERIVADLKAEGWVERVGSKWKILR